LFQPKQNAKTAVKRFSYFSQSQPVSAAYATLLYMMLSIKLVSTNMEIICPLVSAKSN